MIGLILSYASDVERLSNNTMSCSILHVMCHAIPHPATPLIRRNPARAFPLSDEQCQAYLPQFILTSYQTSEKKGKGRVSYTTMKNLNASKDDNPVILIYILLSTILVFSFLGTFLDSSGKRSPKAAVSERS